MSLTTEQIEVLIKANTEDFKKKLDQATKNLDKLSKVSTKSSSTISNSIGKMAKKYLSLAAVVGGTVKSIQEANKRIEDENLFEVSLGSSANAVRAWSEEIEKSVGVSSAWLRKTSGVITNMTKSMGVAGDDAKALGQNFALLAQDMASFYNISAESALEKLQSGLAGQSRALQELGIMVRETDLEQTALALGIKKVNGEFTSAQRAMLVYQTVMKATKNAQGDLARTINTPANQLRMLATNLQNLSVSFGNLFQPLLQVALPALNAITIAATRALNALAKLFGIKITNSTNLYSDLEDDISGVGASADGAADSANKLKKSLAGFDEMNVLTEQESSGSGGSSGSGSYDGIEIDLDSYNSLFDGVKNKAIELADAIGEAFSDMFDTEKIKAALELFKSDLTATTENLGVVLGGLWTDYLQPFLSWTGNDFLPAFFNALGGAINFAGAIIREMWEGAFKPFMDTFLKPIAEFTGGIIVDFLNHIGDAFRAIAENETAVKVLGTLATTLVTIAGITKFNTVMGFLQTIADWKLGVDVLKMPALFTRIGEASGNEFANGMKRGNEVMAYMTGQSAELTKGMTGFEKLTVSLFDGVKNLGAGFKSLWGIIADHPLIAVISILALLLLQNEEFRESLKGLIDACIKPIMNLLQKVGDCIQPIIDIIIELVDIAITPIMMIIDVIASILSGILDALSPIIEAILDVGFALSPINIALELLQPLLELIRDLLKPIVDLIKLVAGVVTDLAGCLADGIRGLTHFGASEEDLAEMNEKLTETAEDYTDALKEQQGIVDDMADSIDALDKAEQKLTEAQQALANAEQASGSQVRLNDEAIKNLVSTLYTKGTTEERLQVIAETYGLSLETNRDQVKTLYGAILDENSALTDLEKKQDKQEENLKKLSESNETLQGYMNDSIETIKEAGLNADQMNDKLRELSEDGSEYSLALRDEIIKDAQEFGLEWNEETQSMQEDSRSTWDKMSEIFSQAGEKFGNWFNEAKQSTEEAFSKIGEWASNKWNDIQNGFNGVKDWFGNTFSGAKDAMSNAFAGVKTWANDRWNDIKGAFSGVWDTFANIGGNIWNGLKAGIGNIAQNMKDMFAGAVNSVKNFLGIHSPSKLFMNVGGYVGEGFAIGLENEADEVDKAFKNLTTYDGSDLNLGSTLNVNASGELKDLDLSQQPIQLLLSIDGESIPVSAERIANALNARTFLDNKNLLTI